MPSSFTVNSAAGYEQLMGRWSRKLAVPFIAFAGVRDGDSILEIGCGNGSLTFALPAAANVGSVTGVDYSAVFVDEARRRNADSRITIEQGDACALRFGDAAFDRALALLVLHFVPEVEKAVAEMARVVRPGGVVAAAVWDHEGGRPETRMFWDTVAALDERARPIRGRYFSQRMAKADEMRDSWARHGLVEVEQISLVIRMEYSSFADYWAPVAAGEGSPGEYIASLETERGVEAEAAVRAAYEAGRPDGPRSFAAVAWACRGIVPGS